MTPRDRFIMALDGRQPPGRSISRTANISAPALSVLADDSLGAIGGPSCMLQSRFLVGRAVISRILHTVTR